ncbi:MAG TPA: DUF4416 domain-containing protein [Synergistaceae bacterium]|nr:DUF4416 domain-containing protein [Synergistaceae bacterium]
MAPGEARFDEAAGDRGTDVPHLCPVKLIAGVLYPDKERWLWTAEALSRSWGAVEAISDVFPFTLTDYYADIAPVLYRRFLSFTGLRDAGGLVDWKRTSCVIEGESRTPRAVNIDPGYVNGARLVLASTKDHAHRIYLGRGIYGEVTMRYRFKRWEPFDYTFPDFATGQYDPFLSVVRERWLCETGTTRRTGR